MSKQSPGLSLCLRLPPLLHCWPLWLRGRYLCADLVLLVIHHRNRAAAAATAASSSLPLGVDEKLLAHYSVLLDT